MSLQLLLWNLNRIIGRQFFLDCRFENQLFSQVRLRHSGVHSGTLRPLKVTSVNRKTQHRPNNIKTLSPSVLHDMAFLEEEGDPLDNFANSISKYSTKANARLAEEQHISHVFREMKFLRAKTVGNKFFRKPPSPNLLTWAAKEQIRYLHQSDPDEWSIEKLSNVFPVSQSSMKKIIKSKVRFHRDKDILEHDHNVLKTWANLKALLDNDDIATTDKVCQAFRSSVGELTIENAAGVQDLPFPRKKTDGFNPRGTFSVIVQDCYVVKKEAMEKSAEEFRIKSEQFSNLLSQVSQTFQVKSQGEKVRSRFLKEPCLGTVDHETSEAPSSEQLSFERKLRNSSLKSLQNVQESKFISQKYKEKEVSNQIEKPMNTKHAVQYNIPLGQENPRPTISGTYISGDCVYDKNGQFLYRIP